MKTTPEDAAIIRSAAREIATEFGIVDVDALQLADLSDTRVIDGRAVGVAEALIAFRKARPQYFGLPERTTREMSDLERIAVLKQIKARDEARQAKRNAAPALAPGETRKSAKDMSKTEYAETLQAIRRRGN